MKVEVIGAYGGAGPGMSPTSLLIDEKVVLDAGSVAGGLDLARQQRIEAVVLTHAHADHVGQLPFLLENLAVTLRPPTRIYGSVATLYALRRHLINNHVWPDIDASTVRPRMVEFVEVDAEKPFRVGDIEWTPFKVDHTVPTFGYLIDDGKTRVAWSSDTGPTQRLWQLVGSDEGVEAVMIEASFDNSRQELADRTGHLTPRRLVSELDKCERRPRVLAHHLKPACAERVREELAETLPEVEILEQGEVYEF